MKRISARVLLLMAAAFANRIAQGRSAHSAGALFVACVLIVLCSPAVAQSSSDEVEQEKRINDICQQSIDCVNYYQNENFLLTLHEIGDRNWVAVKGKKKQSRLDMLLQAKSYILAHHLLHGASAWRYLYCVSRGLAGEAGAENKTTIFSSENIIETFYAFNGTPDDTAATPGIQQVCDALEEYHQRFSSKETTDRVNQEILQKKEKSEKLIASNVWHEILIEFTKKWSPNSNPELTVADWQTKYCVFAASCPASANSPFTRSSPSR